MPAVAENAWQRTSHPPRPERGWVRVREAPGGDAVSWPVRHHRQFAL